MTRQEAINEITNLVNRIYDEFDERRCDSCKWYGEYEYEIPGAEDFQASCVGCALLKIKIGADFCCSKYSKKNK